MNFGCFSFINQLFRPFFQSHLNKILIKECVSSWRRYDAYLSGQCILHHTSSSISSQALQNDLSVESLFMKVCIFEEERIFSTNISKYKSHQLSYFEMRDKMIGIQAGEEWTLQKLEDCLGNYYHLYENPTQEENQRGILTSDDIFWISYDEIGKNTLLSNTHSLPFLPSTISTLNSKPLSKTMISEHVVDFITSYRSLSSLWTTNLKKMTNHIKVRIRKEARDDIMVELVPPGQIPKRHHPLLSIDFEDRKYN